MHELGLTQSILEIALDNAAKNEASRVLKVKVVAGDLTGAIDESLRFYFDYLARGTAAEGAELAIDHPPAIIKCAACGGESRVAAEQVFACPKCDALTVELLSGREFYVDSIEIE
ncbi:MAG: hydrogenase maturation nickel metallochaperone HypA [Candidatus Aquicultor sp.]|nr:hydrogenase maturation nickel metallochaperone HypA [Candidatus Aquicultor sp.]